MFADWLERMKARSDSRVTVPTMFGKAAVYAMPAADGSLVRMLNVGGVLQSATYLDERWAECPFAYLRSFDHLFEAAPALVVKRVLMIGGAGFAYPKSLLANHPGVKLDVVEIDSAMVDVAREHFFLDRLEKQLAAEGRGDDLRIFVEDGEEFLRRGGEGAPAVVGVGIAAALEGSASCATETPTPRVDGFPTYDVIINDAFVGREAVPFFASDEGIAVAKERLALGGLLMANCVAEYTGDAMYRLFSQVERLRDHFANVYVIDASDDQFGGADNYLLIATDGAYPFTDVIPYGD